SAAGGNRAAADRRGTDLAHRGHLAADCRGATGPHLQGPSLFLGRFPRCPGNGENRRPRRRWASAGPASRGGADATATTSGRLGADPRADVGRRDAWRRRSESAGLTRSAWSIGDGHHIGLPILALKERFDTPV